MKGNKYWQRQIKEPEIAVESQSNLLSDVITQQ